MELKKFNYSSAIYFGIIALVFYLIMGILMLVGVSNNPTLRTQIEAQLGPVTPLSSLVTRPVIGGIVFYLVAIVMFAVYNFVAKKYPISWQVDHK